VTESFESDSRFARDAWLRALGKTANIGDQAVTLPALMQRLGGEFGAAPALISSDVSMTYRQLAFRCNQYARWGIAQGLVSGDAVSLLMGNCAEYPAIWLGLTHLGVVVALVNSQLAGEVLAHSINIARPKALIVGADLAPRVAAIRENLPADLSCRVLGSSTQNFAALEPELAALSGEPLRAAERAPPTIDATALYIYTSGTTGLPKAAKVSHYRLMQWSHWFAGMMDTKPSDRMFNCLPLYHSVGGVVAIFATLVSGGDSTAVFRIGLLARCAR
jgi:fatty-acyl-CoA synthase